jgi:hypothetical protein
MLWLVESRLAPSELPVWWTMLGVPLAFVLGRLVQAVSFSRRIATVLTTGLAWVLALIRFTAFPPPMDFAGWADLASGLFQLSGGPNPLQITALATAAAWAAGLRLSARPVGFEQILSEFQFGLLTLLVVFFCAAQWGISLPAMLPVVFIFFALFLLGTAAARSREAGGRSGGEARTHWFLTFASHAAMALGAGLILTVLVTPEVLTIILAFLQAAWDAAIEWAIRLIAFIARLFPQPELKPVGIGAGAGPPPQNPAGFPDLLSIPDHVRRVAAFLVSAFWVVLLAVCLWRVASQIAAWLRRQVNDLDATQVESLPGSFRQDLLRLLRYLRRRVAGWVGWLGYAIGRRRPQNGMPDESMAVRRVYRGLLAWSAAGGCPRRRHQTPHEFLSRLCEWLPQARDQLARITEQYAAVRYGDRRPDAEAVKTLERTWRDVRQIRKSSKNPAKRTHFETRRTI